MGKERTGVKDFISKGVGKTEAEGLGLAGRFSIDHFRGGELIDHREVKNCITNTGMAAVAGCIVNDVTMLKFDYIAIGTGTGAATATNTNLGTELTANGSGRAAATGTRVTTTVTNDTAQFVVTYTFTAGASYAVTESGVFNATSGITTQVMLCRQTFSAVNVASGDTLQITWKVAVTGA